MSELWNDVCHRLIALIFNIANLSFTCSLQSLSWIYLWIDTLILHPKKKNLLIWKWFSVADIHIPNYGMFLLVSQILNIIFCAGSFNKHRRCCKSQAANSHTELRSRRNKLGECLEVQAWPSSGCPHAFRSWSMLTRWLHTFPTALVTLAFEVRPPFALTCAKS